MILELQGFAGIDSLISLYLFIYCLQCWTHSSSVWTFLIFPFIFYYKALQTWLETNKINKSERKPKMKYKQKQNKPNYNSNNITSLKKDKKRTHITLRHKILTVNSQAKDKNRNVRKYQTVVSWFAFFYTVVRFIFSKSILCVLEDWAHK